MLSWCRERLGDLAARAGLGDVPFPVVAAGLALAALAVGYAALHWVPAGGGPDIDEAPPPARTATAATETSRPAEASASPLVIVDVTGAVRRPGVYRLPKGSRANDAVDMAGGALGSAELGAINLARVLDDGEQLVVPVKGQAPLPQAAPAGPSASSGSPTAGARVDINHATTEQLDALPGVGPSTAAKIVQERESNGPYKSVEDLGRVPGIGPKKLDSLKDLVTAG